MDPVSLASSIAGLVSLADIVFTRTYRYIRCVKSAETEAKLLVEELQSLAGILHSLRLRVQELEDEDDKSPAIYKPQHIDACFQTLERLRVKLEKLNPNESGGKETKKFFKRLAWPFSSSDTDTLLKEIERHKAKLQLALAEDSVVLIRKVLCSQKQLDSEIQEIKASLQRRRTWETTITNFIANDEIKDMLRFFGDVEPNERHQTNLSLRHPQTGEWLIESQEFLEWTSGKTSRLWLSGIPGAGKTVLASLVIEETKLLADASNGAHGVAYFYCDYQDEKSQDPWEILGSIATQLAMQNKQCLDILKEHYDAVRKVDRTASKKQISLVKIIKQICEEFENVSIIVDALDECAGNVQSVIKQLMSLQHENGNVRLLFLSRDEQEIVHFLSKDYTHIPIAARSTDLKFFVRAEIEGRSQDGLLALNSADLKEEVIDRLVNEADGMFRWVACQLDYLCELPHARAIRLALKNLPPDLNSTYEQILSRINKNKNKHMQSMVQSILCWTVLAQPKLTIAELREMLSVQEDEIHLDEESAPPEKVLLRACSSLLRKSTDNMRLELAHFTVEEFLKNIEPQSEFFAYRVDPGDGTRRMAQVCLRYLCLKNFEVPPQQEFDEWKGFLGKHPFRRHATTRWFQYAQNHWADEDILKKAKQLFHPKKSFNFLCWARDLALIDYDPEIAYHVRLDSDFTKMTSYFTAQGVTPLHYASLLHINSISIWLLHQGCDVNQTSYLGAPLHCAMLGQECFKFTAPDNARTKSGALPVVQTLLEKGADVKASYRDGYEEVWSVLNMALVGVEDVDVSGQIMQCFIAKGARFDEQSDEYVPIVRSRLESRQLLRLAQLAKPPQHQSSYTVWANETIQQTEEKNGLTSSSKNSANTAMLNASQNDQFDVFNEVLQNEEIEIDSTDQHNGRTALHFAASNGSVEIMKLLLNAGSDVTIQDKSGRTALHCCALSPNADVVPLLLEHGSDINEVDENLDTIWSIAANANNVDILQSLLEFTGIEKKDPWVVPEGGYNPLHAAASAGSEDCVKLLMHHTKDINASNSSGRTLIHECTEYSDQLLLLLLENGLNPCLRDDSGLTALHVLVDDVTDPRAILQKAQALVANGLDVATVTSQFNETALHILMNRCHEFDEVESLLPVVKFLSTAGSLNQCYSEASGCCPNLTPIEVFLKHSFAFPNSSRIFQILFEHDAYTRREPADILSLLDILLHAVDRDRSQPDDEVSTLLMMMMEHLPLGYSMNDDPEGSKALALAIRMRNESLAEMLLNKQANTLSQLSMYGNLSCIELACKWNSDPQLFESLLQHTAREAVQRRILGSGFKLIHWICCDQSDAQIEHLNLLLATGVDVDIADPETGDTALTLAIKSDKVQHAEVLIEHGANIHLRSKDSWSALHAVVGQKGVEMISTFVRLCNSVADWSQRADMRSFVPDDGSEFVSIGNTVYHLASYQTAKVMLDHGVILDCGVINSEGETPFHAAAGRDDIEYLRLLRSKDEKVIAAVDAQGYTALHHATNVPNAEDTLRYLIAEGVPIDAPANNGYTALACAVRKNQSANVSILLEKGASLLGPSGLELQVLAYLDGNTDVARILEDAMEGKAHDLESSRSVSGDQKAHQIRVSRALRIAISRNDSYLCEKAISQASPSDLIQSGCAGCTPIITALDYGSSEIALKLMNSGFSHYGEVCSNGNHIGFQAVQLASRDPVYSSCLQKLLQLSVTKQDYHLTSPVHPIHVAVRGRNVRGLKLLLDHYSSMASQRCSQHLEQSNENSSKKCSQDTCPLTKVIHTQASASGKLYGYENAYNCLNLSTPLHQAASGRNSAVIELLMAYGADIHARSSFAYRTPLHFAAFSGSLIAAEILLKNGADIECRDWWGRTPVILAMQADNVPMLKLLDRWGARFDVHSLTNINLVGWRISKETLAYCHTKGLRIQSSRQLALFDRESVFHNQGLSYWAFSAHYWETTNSEVEHHLLGVLEYYSKNLWKAMLKRIECEGQSAALLNRLMPSAGMTLLGIAAASGNEHAAEVLIQYGADTELLDSTDETPLVHACKFGREGMAKFLVRQGAQVSYAQDGRIFSALHAAKKCPHIRGWILSGRFMDQKKLCMTGGIDGEIRPWSGLKAMEIPLKGSYGRFEDETMLEYAIRLRYIRRKFQGKALCLHESSPFPYVSLELDGGATC